MSRKIVVVEDNEDVRLLLSEMLKIRGFEVILAENGYIGIQKIIKYEPDLVVCDIMMPELDGYEVLKTIRKSATLGNTPFIFLSAKAEKEALRSGMELGADDYLTKPVEADVFIRAVYSRLERSEQAANELKGEVRKIKEKLSAVYSHEVNTPLNGILGLTEILLKYHKTQMSPHVYDLITNIKTAGQRLHRTISNLQKFAEIQQYENLNSDNFYPIGYCDEYKDFLMLELNNIAKNFDRTDDVIIELKDSSLSISYEDLEKIIGEAVDNALKFSNPSEKVKIHSSISGEFMRFEITDDGKGMSKANIEDIDSFTQFCREVNEQQGLGLGLYLLKKIVDLNKGKLSITSKIKEGTKIIVDIPL